MQSAGKRRRSGNHDNSSIDAFLSLRETGLVQTGPKRPKTALSFTPSTPLTSPHTKGRGVSGRRKRKTLVLKVKDRSRGGGRSSNMNETIGAAASLIDAAGDMSDLLSPHGGAPLSLSPSPVRTHITPPSPITSDSETPLAKSKDKSTPKTGSSTRKKRYLSRRSTTGEDESSSSVLETPVKNQTTETPVLRSALKDIQTLSDLRSVKHQQDSSGSASRVSFGRFVTVTEFSPDRSIDIFPTSEPDDRVASDESTLDHDPLHHDGGTDKTDSVNVDNELASETNHTPKSNDHTHQLSLLEPMTDEASDDELDDDGPRLRTPHFEVGDESTSESEETVSGQVQTGSSRKKKAPVRKRQTKHKSASINNLPRTLIKNLFGLACKRRLTKDAMDLVMTFSEAYLKQACKDVSIFARHAGRKTIEVDDVNVLLQRQREITSTRSFEYLVNTHLPLEYAEELLPCAKMGKCVVPPR